LTTELARIISRESGVDESAIQKVECIHVVARLRNPGRRRKHWPKHGSDDAQRQADQLRSSVSR
jgi:hypothetical protein